MSRVFPVLLTCLLAAPLAFPAASAGDSAGDSASEILAENLRCESLVDPLGIDSPAPRLSWTLGGPSDGQHQTAYRILVASSEAALVPGKADLWDTGRVESSRSIQIAYRGKPLSSGLACWWTVRVWDAQGAPSEWSGPGRWVMGLLDPADWKGVWIDDGVRAPSEEAALYEDDPAPLFRKRFDIGKGAARARLHITGLGYYEASVNGRRVGRSVLDPGWTAFGKRVFYSTYDVTGLLRTGENVLGVTLGNGWYNPLPLKMWGRLNLREHLACGRPRLIAQLEIELSDGSTVTIASDETWKVDRGPLLRNNIYLGEVHDARLEIDGWDRPGFDDSNWPAASAAAEPIGALQAQPLPPVEVTAELQPVALTEPEPGIFIFDMGENFSGWVRLRHGLAAGTRINLRYGELLHENGTLNPMTSVCGQIKGKAGDRDSAAWPRPVAWQGDVVIARGGANQVWTPRFTFHAFRYVEVTGLPGKPNLDMVTGLRLHSSVEEVGSFACSDEMLNEIQRMCRRTFLSNLISVQSDCPHRERFGYGGDIVASCDALMLNFDMETFYVKAVRDWADAALEGGMLTDTAPFVGIQYCGVGWAMAHPLLLAKLHQYYGNRRLIEEQYEVSRRWLDLVVEQNEGLIVEKGLSDHEGLEPSPSGPMVTPLFAESARLVARLAEILGREDDRRKYGRLAESIRSAYLDKYFDADIGRFEPGTQASQSFALYLEMAPAGKRKAAVDFLLADIAKRDGHLSTGILGTRFMLDALSREGHAGAAYGIVTQRDFPGWGFMLENGATTLWEHWALSENTFSHNHPMFGSVSEWFYKWLGGIQPHRSAMGFDRIVIQPQIIDQLDWVDASYRSVRGLVACGWKRTEKGVEIDVTIPPNTAACVHLPAEWGGAAPIEVEPGRHRFEVPAEPAGDGEK